MKKGETLAFVKDGMNPNKQFTQLHYLKVWVQIFVSLVEFHQMMDSKALYPGMVFTPRNSSPNSDYLKLRVQLYLLLLIYGITVLQENWYSFIKRH